MKNGLIGTDATIHTIKLISEKFKCNEFEILETDESKLVALLESRDFANLNIAYPYHTDIVKYMDVLDDDVKKINAVDMIVNRDGKLYGYNVQYRAFQYLIINNNISLKNKKVLILIDSNPCVAITTATQELGAKEMIVVDVKKNEGMGDSSSYVDYLDCEIIINASPINISFNSDQLPISLHMFRSCEAVIDLVNNPILTKWKTYDHCCTIKQVIGMQMLVAQTKHVVEMLSDTEIDEQTVHKVMYETLLQQYNIVLIGMPSSGKTTIGKMLQKRLGKSFVDVDDVIVERANMTIPEIFAKSQEAGFRKLETKVALALSKLTNTIISTGGGTIKNKINMDYLKSNGVTIFIDRDLNKLISTDPNRPLSSNDEALKKLYDERKPLYQKYADAIVKNNANIEDTVDEIIHAYYTITANTLNYDIQGGNKL